MRSFIYLKKGALLMGLLILSYMASKAQNINVNAYAFNSEPLIDGIVDDVWSNNEFLEISHFITDEKVSTDNFSGKFKLSWYNNNLYFLFEVTDDILVLHKGEPIWEGDNINLYLDLGNEKSVIYDNNDYLNHFKWGNSDYYERFDGEELIQIANSKTGIEFAQQCDTVNHKFTMEIAIRNIAELNGPLSLSESTTFGLDAGIYDCDDTGKFSNMYTNHLSWVDTTGYAWSDPSKLGSAGFASVRLKSAKVSDAIENPIIKNTIKVYPTMVSKNLTIQLAKSEDLKVEISNILGVKIESVFLRSGNTNIDVTSLKSGLYFVNVLNSKSYLIGSQKILKTD
jgi:hypothetical protein